MKDIIAFFRNILLSKEDRLLQRFGLESRKEEPTQKGLRMAQELLFIEYREEIIQIARSLKESIKKNFNSRKT